MITEEQKQEAEEVVMKYRRIVHLDIEYAINCAIQDRQSVLDAFNKIPYRSKCEEYKIQSLTNQIEYLKSKL